MKLKNIKVGDTLEVKSSIVDEPLNDCLSPDMLCKVTYVEPAGYCGELTVRVTFDGDVTWVNHRHLRKPRQLTGSDLTRRMLADGETNILCYICDDSDESALGDRLKRTVTGFSNGWFHTNSVASWRYAAPVPVEKVTPLSRWRHSNGNIYAVVLIANEYSDYPTTVVYRDYDGRTWSKPLSDWHRSMTKMED